MSIPRILHQTYARRDRLHPDLIENIESMKAANPGWEYRFYDDADIVDFIAREYGPRMLDRYQRISAKYGPARADFFRYLLMYRFGGVYLDVKAALTRPLGEVIRPDDVYLLSHWQNQPGQDYVEWGIHPECDPEHGEWQQWHVVCAPGHPFLEAAILEVMRNIDHYDASVQGAGKPGVLRVTGPIAYSRAITPIIDRHPHRVVDIRADCGFEYSIFDLKPLPVAYDAFFRNHYFGESDDIVLPSPQSDAAGGPPRLDNAAA